MDIVWIEHQIAFRCKKKTCGLDPVKAQGATSGESVWSASWRKMDTRLRVMHHLNDIREADNELMDRTVINESLICPEGSVWVSWPVGHVYPLVSGMDVRQTENSRWKDNEQCWKWCTSFEWCASVFVIIYVESYWNILTNRGLSYTENCDEKLTYVLLLIIASVYCQQRSVVYS